MNFLSANDIYFHTQIKRRVSLNPRYLDENFPKFIEKIIKNNMEGKCIKEGWVAPNSVVILNRSMGKLNTNQFNGNILFDVLVGAMICNIPVNSVIKVKAKKITKLGVMSEMGPLMIIVPREIHTIKEPFRDIKPGTEIELVVVGKTFELNSKVITVYAKLNSEVKKKIVAPARKYAEKYKNADKIVPEETMMPEEGHLGEFTKESEEWEDESVSEMEDEELEGTEEDMSEFEEELDEAGDAGELDTEIIDDETSLEAADELVADENEPFSESSDEEEDEELGEDDEEEDDEGDDGDYDVD